MNYDVGAAVTPAPTVSARGLAESAGVHGADVRTAQGTAAHRTGVREPPRLRSRREAATASAKPMATQTATKPRHWAPPPRRPRGFRLHKKLAPTTRSPSYGRRPLTRSSRPSRRRILDAVADSGH